MYTVFHDYILSSILFFAVFISVSLCVCLFLCTLCQKPMGVGHTQRTDALSRSHM